MAHVKFSKLLVITGGYRVPEGSLPNSCGLGYDFLGSLNLDFLFEGIVLPIFFSSHKGKMVDLPCFTISGWWFQTRLLFSISYMGCHPKPIDELIFLKMVIAPPSRYHLPLSLGQHISNSRINLPSLYSYLTQPLYYLNLHWFRPLWLGG